MKVIIAGGRDYYCSAEDFLMLDMLHAKYHFTEVVSGGATGADTCGEQWARDNGLARTQFLPDWKRLGRLAGPIRNAEMIEYVKPDGWLVVFPGGAGTNDVVRRAQKAGLHIERGGG